MINSIIPALFASALALLPQCDAPTPPERPAQVIFIPQDYAGHFNAEGGDQLNLIMNDDSEELEELNYCNDRGGRLERNPYTEILICFDIDF